MLLAESEARCPCWANGGMIAPLSSEKKSGAPISLVMACFVPSGGAPWAIACAPAAAGTLQGTAFYRERIALPPDAIFEALLQDTSRADAAGEVLGRARLEPAGQPPFHFSISYDDAAIQPGRRYAVRASVTHQGRLLFTSDRSYPVFNGGNGPLTLLLVSARRARGPMHLMPQDENMRPLPVLLRRRSAAR